MASPTIVATFVDKEVSEFLRDMKTRLSKVKGSEKKFVGLLSAMVFSDVMDHFEKEQGSEGPWRAWSISYADHMQKIGRSGNKKLQFTGFMRGSFQPGNYRSTADGPMWFNPAQTKGGFPYAAAHDEGGDQLPKRDFMWLSDNAVEKISSATLQFLIDEGV